MNKNSTAAFCTSCGEWHLASSGCHVGNAASTTDDRAPSGAQERLVALIREIILDAKNSGSERWWADDAAATIAALSTFAPQPQDERATLVERKRVTAQEIADGLRWFCGDEISGVTPEQLAVRIVRRATDALRTTEEGDHA